MLLFLLFLFEIVRGEESVMKAPFSLSYQRERLSTELRDLYDLYYAKRDELLQATPRKYFVAVNLGGQFSTFDYLDDVIYQADYPRGLAFASSLADAYSPGWVSGNSMVFQAMTSAALSWGFDQFRDGYPSLT